jgi:hypothetical protein
MLVSFSVSNFRSIGEEQTLNLVASAKIADHPGHLVRIGSTGQSVVRTAVIYGANAAGKSNVVRAMKFAQSMITQGARPIPPAAVRFRFDDAFGSKPSSFEFRFLTLGKVFTYGFDVETRDICAEWLTVLADGEDQVVFERDKEGKTHLGGKTTTLFPGDKKIGDLLTALEFLPLKTTQLFLNRVTTLPTEVLGKTLKAVIDWLTEQLVVLLPDHRSADLLDLLYENVEFRHLTEHFLEAVGTGVGRLEFETEEVELDGPNARFGPFNNPRRLHDVKPKPDDPGRGIRRQLLAIHPSGGSPATLPFAEESDGTIQLLHLMPVLAAAPKGTKVVVIDELDRSLHPLLCWEFIRLFSETAPGAHKQLVVTTHEAHLLNQDLLRRDEYWFVEKDRRQQTQLASLSDFKVRNDLKIEKGYLQGRFGAIPFIGSMAEIEKLLNPPDTDQEPSCPDDSVH